MLLFTLLLVFVSTEPTEDPLEEPTTEIGYSVPPTENVAGKRM